ncbi:hypothetical protein BGZ95_005888, partial [Linnemannia exigua]
MPQGDEPRQTSVPVGLSSSYPRDHSVEPRMMSGIQAHCHSSGGDDHYPPPTPRSYHAQPPRLQQRYSNQPGTRSSWAGNPSSSTTEFESNFTFTSSSNKASSSSYSSATTPTSATPYFRRSVHHHDPQDDYHHSPKHGTYIPPSSSSSIGHQEYQANNVSTNSLDEVHSSYNGTKSNGQQKPYHHKREGSYSSVDYHYQNSSAQDGCSADLYTSGGGRGVYDSGLTTAAVTGNNNNDNATGKHRNNSVSSNASQSSTSSLSYYPHQSGNKHPCKFPSCGWSFKRYEHLKRHMLVHSKERAFVCDYHGCEKSFSRSDNFSAHLRTHTKKSAAAAAGMTTAHMRRFERQQQHLAEAAAASAGSRSNGASMMIDPIRTNFPNNSTLALVSSGPLSDAPPERRSGASGGGG